MKRSPSHEIKGPGGILPLRSDDEAAVDLVMLIEGETSGRDLEEVLDQFGRSRSTYYEKLRRFREQGIEGLLSRPPGPRSPWRRPLEVVRYVVTTRLRHPERTAGAIAADLGRLGHAVSVRSVERTLSQFGLTRPPARAAVAAGATPVPGAVPCSAAAYATPHAATFPAASAANLSSPCGATLPPSSAVTLSSPCAATLAQACDGGAAPGAALPTGALAAGSPDDTCVLPAPLAQRARADGVAD